jgi:rhamnose utilization protein RhaD (predicted bifunctional aldolase and dehydrogenase)
MKRNELKAKMQELGLEVNDELINYIMTQNGVDIETLKTQHTNELQTKETELNEAKTKISQLEANTSQYADYEELKKFREDAVKKVENDQKLEYLKSIKCKHPELFIEKIDWSKAKFNEEKKTYEGLDDQVKTYQEQYKDMFEVVKQQALNPEQGGSTSANLTGVEKAFFDRNPDLRK